MSSKSLYNWGMFPKVDAEVTERINYDQLAPIVKDSKKIIARGNGRCYGDSSLQKSVVSTLGMNKILAFDTKQGVVQCEAGLKLGELLTIIVPKGFFLPVTPGTKQVTVGGAVASNVHGKNHHKEGGFSKYICSLELMNAQGELLICSGEENAGLFAATIGGMGRTGIIVSVTFTLKPIETAYIKQQTLKAPNLDTILDYFETYNDYTYSVAWIDTLKKGKGFGRSLLLLGEHATANEIDSKYKSNLLKRHGSKRLNVPFLFPKWILNKYSIRLFNALYYGKQRKPKKTRLVHYNTFFYPLDFLQNWNRMYGKEGFTQYQLVIPFETGRLGLKAILEEVISSGCGSFLAVLKTFRKTEEKVSPLSFPMEGYTLALDFKVSSKTLQLMDRLDKIVLEYNGRLYLSKDARMSREMFEKMYPIRGEHFHEKFQSLQSERLQF